MEEPGFDHLRQQYITNHHHRQQQPVQGRKCDEPECASQWRNRQQSAHDYNDQGGGDQRPAGPAFNKWDFVGANDMDDQRLRKQAFDKPAGVEQGRIVPGVENISQHEESQVNEDRADGTDEEDKTLDFTNGPFARLN